FELAAAQRVEPEAVAGAAHGAGGVGEDAAHEVHEREAVAEIGGADGGEHRCARVQQRRPLEPLRDRRGRVAGLRRPGARGRPRREQDAHDGPPPRGPKLCCKYVHVARIRTVTEVDRYWRTTTNWSTKSVGSNALLAALRLRPRRRSQ